MPQLPSALSSAFLISHLMALVLASAASAETSCISSNRPAASLLFPFFELDLNDPEAGTTLISVSNHSDEPVLGLGYLNSPLQGWILPIHTASGRFSVGLNATRVDDLCVDY